MKLISISILWWIKDKINNIINKNAMDSNEIAMANPFEVIIRQLTSMQSSLNEMKDAISKGQNIEVKPIEDEKFNIKEAANYLRVSEGTIHRYKKNKVFNYYKTGRTVYFLRSQIDEALSSQSKKKGASNAG